MNPSRSFVKPVFFYRNGRLAVGVRCVIRPIYFNYSSSFSYSALTFCQLVEEHI